MTMMLLVVVGGGNDDGDGDKVEEEATPTFLGLSILNWKVLTT